jgi:hypothetical protein
MTPRTLWTIILKIFGIYILVQVLYGLPQISTFIFLLAEQKGSGSFDEFAAILFSTGIYLFIMMAFIFRTDWLIDTLQLNKGISEEKIDFNIHRSTVLKIVVIISGVFLFVESLPALLKELFNYWQNINNGFTKNPNAGSIIFNAGKLLISCFLMTGSRLIVNFIERNRKKAEAPNTSAQ